jgi:hypothetical protein
MLIDPKYEGFYGSVERVGKSSVQTLFYHFLGFPLFPQDSYWVTGSDLTSWGDLKVMELKRSVPSIVAGYLRGWSTVGSLWLIGAGIFCAALVKEPAFAADPMPFGRTIVGPILLVLGVLAACAAIVVWLATRRAPSDDELARRAVFQRWLGTACDPALLKDPWSQRDDLKRNMMDFTERFGLGRDFDGWVQLLQRQDVGLPAQWLQMALTVARLERAAPAEKTNVAMLPQLEELAWQRLRAVDPSAASARPQ